MDILSELIRIERTTETTAPGEGVTDEVWARERCTCEPRRFQWPVVAARAWHVRALVATPHRNQELRLGGQFTGELLRARITQVPADRAVAWMGPPVC